jgi:hypothetical protein
MKMTIKILDDIDPAIALMRVTQVVQEGRVSQNNTKFCWYTEWSDNIAVATINERKSDHLVVYRPKK